MADIQVANTDADLSGNTVVTEENAYTITGLHTFDRDPNAPFAVVSGSAVVANLDADKVDGVEAAALLRVDGSLALSANWDAGGYEIRSATFESDVTTGTAPLTIASTTLVTNLNADKLDSQEGTYYLAAANATGTLAVNQGGTGATSLTDGGVLLGSGTGAITAMTALADGEMIVGDGSTDPVAESGATLRTSIGVGTGDSPTFTAVTVGQVDVTAEGDLRLQDNTGGEYVALDAPATVSSSYTLTLPAAVGAVDEVLSLSSTDGTLQWAAASGGTPGGSTTQVQFNNSGSFGGSSGLTYDDSTDTLTIGGSLSTNAIGTTSVDYVRQSIGGAFTSGGASTRANLLAISGALTTATGDTHVSQLRVHGSIVTAASQAVTQASAIEFDALDISIGSGGSLTYASTLLVGGAPTEGVVNYSIWVSGGVTRLGGDLSLDSTITMSSAQKVQWTNSNTYVAGTSSGYVAIGTGGSERMRVSSTGDVGIGTTSPSTMLHVAGDVQVGPSGSYLVSGEVTLADDATTTVASRPHDGMIWVFDNTSSGRAMLFRFSYNNDGTDMSDDAVYWQDPQRFSPTEGGDYINVYSASNVLTIQNKSGASLDLTYFAIYSGRT